MSITDVPGWLEVISKTMERHGFPVICCLILFFFQYKFFTKVLTMLGKIMTTQARILAMLAHAHNLPIEEDDKEDAG